MFDNKLLYILCPLTLQKQAGTMKGHLMRKSFNLPVTVTLSIESSVYLAPNCDF